ncbi:beta-1,3-galactosyltransferase 5-like isoform X1 [Drosophila miranda]|uniref:beta-1,3-galactosyltransferase 5-like isoform X1 n=2 Tax=Drosophila miranda TaxID=7229 RepID=UPI0007E62C6D|nr:beta-1,3-galactosyltransferase 5-like isoform X1 [Drosophila miranda]
MRLFMVLGAVIIINLIDASFSKESKHVPSIGGFPMSHKIEKNGFNKISSRRPSENHGSNIGNYPLTERSNRLEKKHLSLVLSSIQAFSADSNQLLKTAENEDIKTIKPSQFIKNRSKSRKMAHPRKKRHKPVPIVSPIKVQTSSAAPLLLDHPVLTMKLYEPGHLNEEIDIQRICMHRGLSLRLLILITSAQTHFMARMSIRQTWIHYGSRRDVGIAFVLGRTTNATLNEALNKENYIYGDMIRGNFIDSYFNLTLKTISMLEWADTHCPNVKFILKTDDDMFINVPKLLDFIGRQKDNRTIYGRLVDKRMPERHSESKEQQNGAIEYTTYTTGPAYLLTGDIIHELYVQSLRTNYIPLEDVFTTGIVAENLKIERMQSDDFRNVRTSLNPCYIRNVISVHNIEAHEQFYLWRKLLDPTIKCKTVWRIYCGAVQQPK